MKPAALLVLLALAAAPAAAEVTVHVSGGHVDLVASAAPLADVLDRLARQTGMKVVYEGPAPRQLVTLTLHGRTPAETILSLFEGLGLNYALVSDAAGAEVRTLVVAGAATASSSSASSSRGEATTPAGPRRPFGPPPGASPETMEPAFDEANDEAEPEEPGFAGMPPGAPMSEPGAPMPPDPTLANPAMQGPSVAPPGAGMIPTQPSPGFSASPFTPQPQPFPPLPPGVPGAPPGTGEPAGSGVPPPG